jgi:signal transduction histidine kinase
MMVSSEPVEQLIDAKINSVSATHLIADSERREAIKSLEEIIANSSEINYLKGKADALQKKGRLHIQLSEYKEALDAFLQEEKIQREIGDKIGIANAIHNVANAYHYLSNLQKAMMLYLESMQRFEALNERSRLRSVYNNIGFLHFKIGNYAECLDFYLKCLKLSEELGDKADIAGALNAIGTVYQKVGESELALSYYFKSLKLYQEVGSEEGVGMAYGNIGAIYHEAKRYDDALEAHYQSKRAFEEVRNPYHLSMALASIAASYDALAMENEAAFFYEESLKAAKKSRHIQVEVKVLYKHAQLFLKRNENDDALHLLRNALRIAKKAQLKEDAHKVYGLMVEAYRKLGDFESALSAHESFYELEKEIFNEESNRKIRNMQVAFELQQGKRETELERKKNAELTTLNKELVEANRLKSELLSIAAHDLKNPLQSILGFAELIKERVQEPLALQYAQRIRTASERMVEMISLLLQDAAISQGKISLTFSAVNLSAMLEGLAEMYRPNADIKSQIIETSIEPNCLVKADEQYLAQIFDNLLSNAIKYSPNGKKIMITCKKADESEIKTKQGEQSAAPSERQILASIRDEGQGLSDEDRQKLFKKFQRLSAKPTANESSTGLGLAIVKQLVELHQGEVWAESEGKDKGATFFVQLPIFQNE